MALCNGHLQSSERVLRVGDHGSAWHLLQDFPVLEGALSLLADLVFEARIGWDAEGNAGIRSKKEEVARLIGMLDQRLIAKDAHILEDVAHRAGHGEAGLGLAPFFVTNEVEH